MASTLRVPNDAITVYSPVSYPTNAPSSIQVDSWPAPRLRPEHLKHRRQPGQVALDLRTPRRAQLDGHLHRLFTRRIHLNFAAQHAAQRDAEWKSNREEKRGDPKRKAITKKKSTETKKETVKQAALSARFKAELRKLPEGKPRFIAPMKPKLLVKRLHLAQDEVQDLKRLVRKLVKRGLVLSTELRHALGRATRAQP